MTRLLLVEDDRSLGATLHERLVREGVTTREEMLRVTRD